MRLVAVSMVKNECDIIEAFCRHTAAVVDEHLIFDHTSTDGTRILLAKLVRDNLPIRIFEDDRVEYLQSERTTELMRRAVHECGADWILPLDADEFLQAHGGPDAVRYHLAKLAKPQQLWMHDYAPHPHDDAQEPNPALRLQHWTGLHKRPQLKVIVPRAFASLCRLSEGNHLLYDRVGTVAADESEQLWLAHFPVRNCAQVVGKIITGELQRLMRATNSEHYQAHFEHLQAGGGSYFTEPSTYLRGLYQRPAEYWGQPLRWSPPLEPWPRLAAALLPFVKQIAENYGQLRPATPRPNLWNRMFRRAWGHAPTYLREWTPPTAPTLADYGAKLVASGLQRLGEEYAFVIQMTNVRTASWIPQIVNVGVQAWNADGVMTDLDHSRHTLPTVVHAGDTERIEIQCVPPPNGGFFTVNLVVEHVGWFATPAVMVDPATLSNRTAA